MATFLSSSAVANDSPIYAPRDGKNIGYGLMMPVAERELYEDHRAHERYG